MGAPGSPGVGRGAEDRGEGGGGAIAVPAHALVHSFRGRGVRGGHAFLCYFLCSSLWCESYFLGRGLGGGQRGDCNADIALTVDGNWAKCTPPQSI